MARTAAKAVADQAQPRASAERSQRRTGQISPVSGTGLRVVAFARCSTGEQANGYSLPAQRAELENWCEREGAELVAFFIDIMTSRRIDRLLGREAAMTAVEALTEAEEDTETVLLVRSVDRASRSMIDGMDLMARAQRNGWRLLGVDGTDSSNPEQELPNNARLMVAQEERRLISRRTKEGLAIAKAKGHIPGPKSRVPGHIAARIVEKRDAGESWRLIAAGLDADGVETPGDSERWRPDTVQAIYRRVAEAAV